MLLLLFFFFLLPFWPVEEEKEEEEEEEEEEEGPLEWAGGGKAKEKRSAWRRGEEGPFFLLWVGGWVGG